MSTATELRGIAKRLRDINPDSPGDAERYIQRHTGDACRQIQLHWKTIIERAGIDWTCPEPFPADEHPEPGTDRQLWAMAWQSIARVLWFSMRGHHWPGMPDFTTIRREPGLTVATVTDNATDWKERAKDHAEILEAVAGWLSEEPPMKPPKPDRTEKVWTPQDVEKRIRLELSCGGETETQYLFATADELASLIGCDRKTAMKTTFWKQDKIELRQSWRLKNGSGKRTRKRDI